LVISSQSAVYHPGGGLPPEAAIALLLRAAGVSLLNGRALAVAVRTIHAAITFIGLEQCAATCAFIEELARVCWHQLSL